MAYERLRPESETRYAAWGPNSTRRLSIGNPLRSLNRRPDRYPEWTGRLAGGRLGLGGGIGFQAGPALVSSASSMRLDDRQDDGANMRAYANQIDEHSHELHQMRKTIEELSRKLDEVLAQRSS
jgi:hypothetical protein